MTAAAVVLTLAALAGRSVGWAAFGVTAVAGVTGVVMPLSAAAAAATERVRTARVWLPVVAVGAAAVALVAWKSPLDPGPVSFTAMLASAAAAVAEEAFFRRLVYGWLERLSHGLRPQAMGPAVAIAGAAAAFALVHVPLHGPETLPVNLAAGILFGWQRWATGTWTAPAVTHVIANIAPL